MSNPESGPKFSDLPNCGDFDMRIAPDGTWFYRGTPINRKPLVKLFSTVLRRESDGEYWLVTPAERGRIAVEDAPFTAVEVTAEGSGRDQALTFRTNLDESVIADCDHPIRVAHRRNQTNQPGGEPRPYVLVRPGLEALILRSVFYHLVDLGEVRNIEGVEQLGVWEPRAVLRAWPPAGFRIRRAHREDPLMERTLISERFALAPAPGRRSAPGNPMSAGAVQGSVVAVPLETAPSRRGDHDLNPDMLPTRALIPAAVLVGLVERPEGIGVLFTKRNPHLSDHAGQISFPGGRIDATDADAFAAALREAEEEVGLPGANVEMIGRLDTYVTRTGFEVTPCVGFVKPQELYRPDPFEVAEVFEVPLHFFRPKQSRKLESRIYQGKERFFYAYPWNDYYIWGATAGMLNNLIEVLGHLDEA